MSVAAVLWCTPSADKETGGVRVCALVCINRRLLQLAAAAGTIDASSRTGVPAPALALATPEVTRRLRPHALVAPAASQAPRAPCERRQQQAAALQCHVSHAVACMAARACHVASRRWPTPSHAGQSRRMVQCSRERLATATCTLLHPPLCNQKVHAFMRVDRLRKTINMACAYMHTRTRACARAHRGHVGYEACVVANLTVARRSISCHVTLCCTAVCWQWLLAGAK
jgi:hypothetical protein